MTHPLTHHMSCIPHIRACWVAGDVAIVWYDGRTPANWVTSFAYTGGMAVYGACSSSQAFKKGGLAGNGRTVIDGSMTSLFTLSA